MKCPYQTKIVHIPEDTEGYIKRYEEYVTEFCNCIQSECPFYYIIHYKSRCRRAEREGRNENV